MTPEEFQLSGSGYEATVGEAGGSLRSLTFHGTPLIAGPRPGAPVSAGRGQLLIPWPNRIRGGSYTYAGTSYQLALSEPARFNASHGLARWLAWHRIGSDTSSITLGTRVVAQSGYPWTLDLTVRYDLSADGLGVELRATNRSDTPAPFAAGMHPYLDAGAPLDECVLTLPARTVLVTDDRLIPVDARPADSRLSAGLPLRGVTLDDGFGDLTDPVIRLEGAHAVEVRLGPAWHWVQVFTGDTLPEPRQGLAVEPMTAPADAFNSGRDLIDLAPGATWHGTFTISAR